MFDSPEDEIASISLPSLIPLDCPVSGSWENLLRQSMAPFMSSKSWLYWWGNFSISDSATSSVFMQVSLIDEELLPAHWLSPWMTFQSCFTVTADVSFGEFLRPDWIFRKSLTVFSSWLSSTLILVWSGLQYLLLTLSMFPNNPLPVFVDCASSSCVTCQNWNWSAYLLIRSISPYSDITITSRFCASPPFKSKMISWRFVKSLTCFSPSITTGLFLLSFWSSESLRLSSMNSLKPSNVRVRMSAASWGLSANLPLLKPIDSFSETSVSLFLRLNFMLLSNSEVSSVLLTSMAHGLISPLLSYRLYWSGKIRSIPCRTGEALRQASSNFPIILFGTWLSVNFRIRLVSKDFKLKPLLAEFSPITERTM